MPNPFGSAAMGAGYATARPRVHPEVIERIRPHIACPVTLAVDVGCGAGLSTLPLNALAAHTVGIDPSEDMVRNCPAGTPGLSFAVARAEDLPFHSASAGLMTAAGSLNYADLGRFFPEAARVLAPGGVLAVYDFSPGRSFPDSPALDEWFARFIERYPFPVNSALDLNPEVLAGSPGFHLFASERFEIGIGLDAAFYLNYVMTETNVAAATSRGKDPGEIRRWCEDGLHRAFGGRLNEVLFRGYFALLQPTSPAAA